MNAPELSGVLWESVKKQVETSIRAQEMRQFVEKYVEVLNALDLDALEKFHTDDSVSVAVRVMERRMDRGGLRQYQEEYRHAFPDGRLTVENIIVDADRNHVAFQWVARATHKGNFMGIEPTNKQAEVRGCTVLEMRDGKIAYETSYSDTAALMRQLGLLPPNMLGGGKPEGGKPERGS